MGVKEFLKQVNDIADKEHTKPSFDKSLNGAHIYNKEKVCKCERIFDGTVIDIEGNKKKIFPYGYAASFNKNFIAGQKGYEEKEWACSDRTGNILWKKKEAIHHDLYIDDKEIITFSKQCHKYKGREIDFDCIHAYDTETGKLLWRWSVWEHLHEFKKLHKTLSLDFPKIPFLPDAARRKEKSPWGGHYDYYRFNSLHILDHTHPQLKEKGFVKGNILITSRHASMLFLLDRKTKAILWHLKPDEVEKKLEGPHGAQLLENNNLLIFDNGRYRGQSRVIEFNPLTKKNEWEYTQENFFTLSQGFAQRLENGNTLITQSEQGRIFEITHDKKLVWEYYHPDKQDKTNSKYPQSYGQRQWIYRAKAYK